MHCLITIKSLYYVKINIVDPLYFIIDNADGYIEESNGNKYLMLVSADKGKDTLKKYAELYDKTSDLIKSITNISGDYVEKYLKIKFNSDYNLSLTNILKLHNLIIVAKSVFKEDQKYYPQVFLDECLYES